MISMNNSIQPKYINANEVEKILTWPLVNQAVEEALKAIDQTTETNKEVKDNEREEEISPYKYEPARLMLRCERPNQILLTMPSFIAKYHLNSENDDDNTKVSESLRKTIACKVVTSFHGNENRRPPLANIQAHILLFDNETGQLKCLMDGTQITAWRTAAASIVATKYLYIQPVARKAMINVAIIGCGQQGRSHALGMCSTFNVAEIYLWNRTKSKANNLAMKLHEKFPKNLKIHVTDHPKDAVLNADVICVGTYSPNALIDYSMLKPSNNIHINTVGAGQVHYGEVSQDIYDHGVVYVDSMRSAQHELSGLKAHIAGEVGHIIRSGITRSANERITIFQSMGTTDLTSQDELQLFNNFELQ